MSFYFDRLGHPRVYFVIGDSVYTEKYSGVIVGEFYYPDKRKYLSSPFNRIEIIEDKFVYSYDTPEQKAWIDWANLRVNFGHRACMLEENLKSVVENEAENEAKIF